MRYDKKRAGNCILVEIERQSRIIVITALKNGQARFYLDGYISFMAGKLKGVFMKRIFALLLVVLTVVSVTPMVAMATESSNDTEYGEVSLGEIQELFIAHLDDVGLSLEPGTMAYYEYIVEQLFERTDDILRSNENYDLLHAYMVEYKVTYEDYLLCQSLLADEYIADTVIADIVRTNDCVRTQDNAGNVEFSISDSFLSKTLNAIIEENANRYNVAQSNMRSAKVSGYSAPDAAAYAVKWGEDRNGIYPNYNLSGGDCTNFVSQCIYAGGIDMNGSSASVGTIESTSQWYCIYIKSTLGVRRYAVTTSWLRVSDFNTYLTSLATKSTKTSLSSLISSCSAGDVVQLADKTTGTPYHSIIINAKDSTTAYFCGHSSNRSNEDVIDFLDDSSDKFILFDLT